MRLLESLLLIANLPLLAWCFSTCPRPAWALAASLLALTVLGCHAFIEGCRLQLAPAYLATVLPFACYIWPWSVKIVPWLGALIFVCLIGAAAMGTIMPVFEFPTPTGPYTIGSTTRHLIDSTRPETQGGSAGACRELLVKIWYPADHPGTREIYRSESPLTFKNRHLRLVKLHSFTGVSLAGMPSRFPVVIVSPAWTGTCNQYVFLVEELASHGFIVVGIDHPYGSHRVSFPDGRTIDTVLGTFLDYDSDAALEASLRNVEDQLTMRTADVHFTLDELARLDQDDPSGLLTGRIDLSRVGACGHSFGGAVAFESCATDSRVKLAVNLDGLIFGSAATSSIGKPLLLLEDDTTVPALANVPTFNDEQQRYWTFIIQNVNCIRQAMSGSRGYLLGIRGAGHMNFHDHALYTPLRGFTDVGSIRPLRAMEITNAYVLAFLQSCLNGEDSHLLDPSSSQYPEVAWKYFREN